MQANTIAQQTTTSHEESTDNSAGFINTEQMNFNKMIDRCSNK